MESLKNLWNIWNTIWGLNKQDPFPKKQSKKKAAPKKKAVKKRGRPKKK